MTQELSMVQRGSRTGLTSVRGRKDKQAERESYQGEEGLRRVLPCIEGFQMADNSDFGLIRICRIDHHKAGSEGWLQ